MENNGKYLDLGQESEKIKIIETEKEKKVLVMGKLYMSWQKTDEVASKVAIAQLYEAGLAKQEDLAKIFNTHINSVYNYITAYKENGIKGLIEQPRGAKESWKVTPDIRCQILFSVLKEGEKEYKKIQEVIERRTKKKISIGSIWQVLRENGFIKEQIEIPEMEMGQGDLFEERNNGQLTLDFSEKELPDYEKTNCADAGEQNKEDILNLENDETISSAGKSISSYSRSERIYLDQLEQGFYSLYAGGLLFIPLLGRYSFLGTIRRVIKNEETEEGYSLEQMCLTLFYFDVFGFRSIENFKTVYPEEFGILIGKLNSPGIRTLRRFLHHVRELKIGEELMDEFAKEYLKTGLVKRGVLYIDEHFLPYHGGKEITMGWFTIRDRALKGSHNFVVNDAEYNPLLFLIRPSSEDLLEKIPEIIAKARKLAEVAGLDGKDLIIIFDREGYCAELFRRLDGEKGEAKVIFICWAKYADKWVNDFDEEKFDKEVTVKYEIQKPEVIKYFETERQMNKYGKIRAIVIESGSDKKRMAIYTNAGSSDFSVDEFNDVVTVNGLCQAIIDDNNYGLTFISAVNSLEMLNELLTVRNFYDICISCKKNLTLTDAIRDLKQKTENYRNIVEQLTEEQKGNIKKLNRKLLELVYPQNCPKNLNALGTEIEAGLIIQLICRRWGQENLIKVLKLRHLIDYHPGYVWEELEEQPLVDNPELLELKQRRANLKSQLHGLELNLIEKMLKEKNNKINLEEIQKREIKTFADIRGIESQITLISQKIDELPKEKKFDEVHDAVKLGELDYEKKRFLDCIKVFVYHMEKKMCEILAKYYEVRNVKKEIWPALAMITRRGAYVKLEQGKLIVRLKRFKNSEIDYAARHLCEELNQTKLKTLDKFRFPLFFEVE